MPDFINGRDLSRRYYEQIVAPIITDYDPELAHAAGLIRYGSETLGFDDVMSTDHEWGPSVTIFLREDDADQIPALLARVGPALPSTFMGYPTRFRESEIDPGTLHLAVDAPTDAPHKVTITTLRAFMQESLAWDITEPLTIADWLTFPSQSLLVFTTGPVHHDAPGEVTRRRQQLAWYPHELWLYIMAAQWNRIGEEEALMGRAGLRGDELGATLIANRLVSDVMRLGFLMEKRYAPYAKWFGTGFAQLDCAADFMPALTAFQLAADHAGRQVAYARVVKIVTAQHNRLNLTAPIEVNAKQYFGRPLQVSRSTEISAMLHALITDPEVKRLFDLPTPIGNIDQISDETTVKSYGAWRDRLRALYAMA